MDQPEDTSLPVGIAFAEAYPAEEYFSTEVFGGDDVVTEATQPDDTSVEQSLITSENDNRFSDPTVGAPSTIFGTDIHNVDVSHPWKLIDYHLYLNWIQRGKNEQYRRNSMCLFDGHDSHPFTYRDFFVSETSRHLELATPGPERKVLFGVLPVAEFGFIFNGIHYVLGFDLESQELFVRSFPFLPEINDLWNVWNEGITLYRLTIEPLYTMMQKSINSQGGTVDVMPLSASNCCVVELHNDDPGLEVVIVIQFCQWIIDFADILFDWNACMDVQGFKEELAEYMNQWRLVLARASYRAWSEVQELPPKEIYRRWKWTRRVTRDLYCFEESRSIASLRDGTWSAPSQETCGRIRKECWARQKKETKEGVENLFLPPDTDRDSQPSLLIDEMLARHKKDDACMLCSPAIAAVPEPLMSPPSAHAPSCSSISPNPSPSTLFAQLLRGIAQQIEHQGDDVPLHVIMAHMCSVIEDDAAINTAMDQRDKLQTRAFCGALYGAPRHQRRDSGCAMSEQSPSSLIPGH